MPSAVSGLHFEHASPAPWWQVSPACPDPSIIVVVCALIYRARRRNKRL
jgi:hypothetical protein